ncbi:MAG: hypothetical protein H0U00_00595 [Actinobacteria bacterium]|nr:hypothetical protein [Actinomycetota bacterium]
MRKFLMLAGVLVALVIPASALAVVSLHEPHVGLGCSDGGTFHFVANGVNGQVGALTVNFSGPGDVTDLVSTKFNKGTNHWTIDASGTILTASATVGDKLVLSDYTCDEKKDKK